MTASLPTDRGNHHGIRDSARVQASVVRVTRPKLLHWLPVDSRILYCTNSNCSRLNKALFIATNSTELNWLVELSRVGRVFVTSRSL